MTFIQMHDIITFHHEFGWHLSFDQPESILYNALFLNVSFVHICTVILIKIRS